jgi:hypothetical protein
MCGLEPKCKECRKCKKVVQNVQRSAGKQMFTLKTGIVGYLYSVMIIKVLTKKFVTPDFYVDFHKLKELFSTRLS